MTTRVSTLDRSDRQTVSVAMVAGALVYVVGVALSMGRMSYDAWAGLVIVPVIGGGSLVLLRRLAPRAESASLVPLLSLALVAKAIGTIVRYVVTFGVYDGNADATNYHQVGAELARQYRHGDFHVVLGAGSTSTGFMKVVTGLVYTVTGPSKVAGFAVFSAASFWGLYLTFRAFQIALPTGNAKRYAVLIFFLPSMLFWPSSIGKEAWMTFALGLTAYGAARLFTHLPRAYTPLVLGLLASMIVRPHVAVAVIVALVAGFVVRPTRGRGWRGGRTSKVLGIAVIAVVGVLAARQMQDALHLNTSSSFGEALDVAQERTDEGGSSFEAARIRSAADLPWAAVTVLFRPFPNEAGNAQALISGVEGVALMGLFVVWWRQLARSPRVALRNPYVAFALVYSTIFVFAFSSFGNFGIISRQRVQLFPFVLVLLCLNSTARRSRQPAPAPLLVGARQ